jgi:hypothetical protein
MLVLVSTKVRQNFKIARLKGTIFQKRGALDVKPVILIWRISLLTVGLYSGPPHHAKKENIISQNCPFNSKTKKKFIHT